MNHPHTYLPGPEGLLWLAHESPRFRLVFDEREGVAAAWEIAALLWPATRLAAPCPDLGGQSPEDYVASLLDEQLGPGLRAEGDYFCALRPPGERPPWLVRWPDREPVFEAIGA